MQRERERKKKTKKQIILNLVWARQHGADPEQKNIPQIFTETRRKPTLAGGRPLKEQYVIIVFKNVYFGAVHFSCFKEKRDTRIAEDCKSPPWKESEKWETWECMPALPPYEKCSLVCKKDGKVGKPRI